MYTMTSRSAPGYRFHPSDEELVNHYLKLKMSGYDHQVPHITELNVCEFEPWDLPGLSVIQSEDPVWYFFSPRNCKYTNSQRVSRITKAGYWKVTGKDRKVRMMEDSKEVIGVKKTLIFYEGRTPNSVRTNWVMHEYNPTFNLPNQRDYVLCKIKRNGDDEEGESSFQAPSKISGSQNQYQHQYQNNPHEEDLQMQMQLASFEDYNEMDYSLNSAFPTTQLQNFQYDGSGPSPSAKTHRSGTVAPQATLSPSARSRWSFITNEEEDPPLPLTMKNDQVAAPSSDLEARRAAYIAAGGVLPKRISNKKSAVTKSSKSTGLKPDFLGKGIPGSDSGQPVLQVPLPSLLGGAPALPSTTPLPSPGLTEDQVEGVSDTDEPLMLYMSKKVKMAKAHWMEEELYDAEIEYPDNFYLPPAKSTRSKAKKMSFPVGRK